VILCLPNPPCRSSPSSPPSSIHLHLGSPATVLGPICHHRPRSTHTWDLQLNGAIAVLDTHRRPRAAARFSASAQTLCHSPPRTVVPPVTGRCRQSPRNTTHAPTVDNRTPSLSPVTHRHGRSACFPTLCDEPRPHSDPHFFALQQHIPHAGGGRHIRR
jgi:hypothetical protein